MSIAYVVLTCGNYEQTRFKAVIETWGSQVDELIKLSDDDSPVLGYDSCPYKYVTFFRRVNVTHDWYVLVDDDTYVNVKMMNDYLSKCDPNESIVIGNYRFVGCMTNAKIIAGNVGLNDNVEFPRGGAGIIVSKTAMIELSKYVISQGDSIAITKNSDTSIGLWMREAKIARRHDNVFRRDPSIDSLKVGGAITAHFITPETMREVFKLSKV
jgi:hypothetical protein